MHSELKILRKEFYSVRLFQAIHVIDQRSVKEAIEVQNFVDALLLDSSNPDLDVKDFGGTGRTHNWEINTEVISKINLPVFLAGGLNPGNVRRAINLVKPYDLDVCSSVRTNNVHNMEKLNLFFKWVNNHNDMVFEDFCQGNRFLLSNLLKNNI